MNKQSEAIVNALDTVQRAIQAVDPTYWDKEDIQSVYTGIENTYEIFRKQTRAWEGRISQGVGDISEDEFYKRNPEAGWQDYEKEVSGILEFMGAWFGYSTDSEWGYNEWGWHGGWASSNCY